jgi:Transposase protein
LSPFQNASPQKQRARKIVDMVLVTPERVPPHVLPAEVADRAGLPYASLSNRELVDLLLLRDKELAEIKRDSEHQRQHQNSREKELEQFHKLKTENDSLKSTLEKTVTDNNSLHRRLQDAWEKGKEAGIKEASLALEGIFSETQLNAIMTKKRVVWAPDDLSSAAALHACSAKAYRFIRTSMKIPLPSEGTIRRWAAKSKIVPGLQDQVIKILEKLGKDMKPAEKTVVFSFDEMILSKRAQHDQGRDAVVGPHSHVQVVFIRSLTGNWKQPVYFDFDKEMTKEVKSIYFNYDSKKLIPFFKNRFLMKSQWLCSTLALLWLLPFAIWARQTKPSFDLLVFLTATPAAARTRLILISRFSSWPIVLIC